MKISAFEPRELLGDVLMRSLGSIVSILVVAVIAPLIYKFYFTQTQSTGATTLAQSVNVLGVKNDLLALAESERMYQAEHSRTKDSLSARDGK